MKYKAIATICLFCAALFASVSCEKVSKADMHPNHKPESPEPEEPVETDINSIYDLNMSEGYVNSHLLEWQTSSLEMDFRSLQELEYPTIGASYANYPRIKRLKNGALLLIYQQNTSANDIYFNLSNNYTNWSKSQLLFASGAYPRKDGTMDVAHYSSADALVLQNGDVLAFAAMRMKGSYTTDDESNGVMMRRSTDNGKTWGDYELICRTACWEPSALQLEDGEIQVYFTDNNPQVHDVLGENGGDSGTSLIRSKDNGKTWEFAGKIIRQRTSTDTDGNPIFTDQMPVAIQLNGSGTIAVACESRWGVGDNAKYHLSMAYSADNWAYAPLSGDQEGPEDRLSNFLQNQAAPYLRQFRSGETLLGRGISRTYNVSIGNVYARDFCEPVPMFEGKGAWGSFELCGSHDLIAVFPRSYSSGNNTASAIQMARFVLNHRVNATKTTPSMKGTSNGWEQIQDALFIGSETQAQAAFRFAYDEQNFYILIERSDDNLTAADGFDIMIQSGNATGEPLTLEIKADATTGKFTCGNTDIKLASTANGDFNEIADDDGIVAEIAVPLSLLKVVKDKILFNAVLFDEAGNDTFTGLTSSNYRRWHFVGLCEPPAPPVQPEPGTGEDINNPSWSEGEENNPWN